MLGQEDVTVLSSFLEDGFLEEVQKTMTVPKIKVQGSGEFGQVMVGVVGA